MEMGNLRFSEWNWWNGMDGSGLDGMDGMDDDSIALPSLIKSRPSVTLYLSLFWWRRRPTVLPPDFTGHNCLVAGIYQPAKTTGHQYPNADIFVIYWPVAIHWAVEGFQFVLPNPSENRYRRYTDCRMTG